MFQWLRRRLLAGFFVMVPLVVSVVALVWLFRLIDRFTSKVSESIFGRTDPLLSVVITAAVVLGVGVLGGLATNVLGRRLLQRGEALLLHVPVFRTIYAPVKQLIAAFSPDNESGFKRVVLVEDAAGECVMGFMTKEFTVDRGDGPERLIAVYVPTNNLYLGNMVVSRPDRVSFPEISVEEGVRIFLTGGMALPSRVRAHRGRNDHVGEITR